MSITHISFSILSNVFSSIPKKISEYGAEIILSSVILLLGYIIGKSIEKMIYLSLERFLGLTPWLKKKKLDKALYNINLSKFYSALVKWYIYIIFITQAVYPYNIVFLNRFMSSLITIYPKIAAFGFVTTIALLLGEVVKNFILSMDFPNKEKAASVGKATVLYVLIVSILDSVGINVEIFIDLFKIVMITIGVAIGIALGIGLGFTFRKDIEKSLRSFRRRGRKR